MLNTLKREQTRILFLEGIHSSAVEFLKQAGFTCILKHAGAMDQDDLQKAIREAEVIGIRSRTQLTADILHEAKSLQCIGCFCIGTNQVDLQAAQEMGVPVFNAPHANTRSVAELVMGWTVMLMRNVFRRSQELHRGVWAKTAKGSFEIRGKTMGIIGYGHIGSQVSILAEAMGMNVVFLDIEPKLPLGNARAVRNLSELLGQSDVISLHVPQTPQTAEMIGNSELSQMKPGASLINASRGNVVVLEALAEHLQSGHIKGAAIDVYPVEPKTNQDPFVSPLIGMENVILTPHIGGSTVEAQENIGVDVAHKINNFMTLGTTVGAVNFPALNLEAHDHAHRILHIHQNIPGVLREINRVFANEDINILGQHLNTQGQIGYVVLDVENTSNDVLLKKLQSVKGTIKVRLLS